MASTLAITLAISILAFLSAVPTTSQTLGCGTRLLLLAPCTPFVQGVALVPSDTCCGSLINVYRNRPHCLCDILDGSTQLPINLTLAQQLPTICRLALPTGNDTCPAITGLSLPPLGPPESQDMAGSGANSSAPASPAEAMPPTPKTNNLLLGLNQGGKLKAEGVSIAMVAITLLLAGAF